MTLRVNNNIAALNSRRHLNANNRVLNVRLERLASGLKLNRAADDAAGEADPGFFGADRRGEFGHSPLAATEIGR